MLAGRLPSIRSWAMPTSADRLPVTVQLPDGRHLAVDDVGTPDGRPVLYVHGTPDSRLARHPDDTLAAGLGIRLLAVDRPGFGWSSADPTATVGSFGDDIGALATELGLDGLSLLAWSAGAVWALGVAATHPDLVDDVTVVGGLVPVEAFADPEVREAGGDARLAAVEAAEELGADEAASMIGPMLVPDPPTPELALEHLEATHDAVTTAELAGVPGAADRMAEAMLDAVRSGTDGLVRDVAVHLAPLDVDLADVACPVHLVYGELDGSCPPAFGVWFAAHLPHADLTVVPGAGHALMLSRWADILGRTLTS